MNQNKKIFKNLRDRFMKMKKEYKPSGSAGGMPIEPSWPYYKQLQFLSPFVKHRQTKGNFHKVAEESQSEDSFQIMGSDTIDPTEIASSLMGTIETNNLCNLDSAISSPSSSISERATTPTFENTPCLSAPKKAKRPKNDSDSSEYLMWVLKNTNEFISSASQKEELDEGDLFGQSVGKQLKNLNPYHKSLAKLKIRQVMNEVAWQQDQTN